MVDAATTPRVHSGGTAPSRATGFYTAAEAARIARVPRARVAAWRREGIVLPTVHAITDTDGEDIGYTFEALVYLRLLRLLREQRVPLIQAVKAIKHLRDRFGPPGPAWEDARIFVANGEVMVEARDEWDVTVATRGGQRVATPLMGEAFERMRGRADALLVPEPFLPTVEIDPRIHSGLPVIRGTTIQTSVVYHLYQREQDPARVRAYYPWLSPDQVAGAVAFEQSLDAAAA